MGKEEEKDGHFTIKAPIYMHFQWLHFWSLAKSNMNAKGQKALLGFSKYPVTLANVAKKSLS